MAMSRELENLVSIWMDLVVSQGRQRRPDHLEKVLHDLGPMPPIEAMRDRAMWVGALINPIPALGVSLEIRPVRWRSLHHEASSQLHC